jgi:F0F1-type ATP synthase membrane subunit b/b'
MSKRKVLVSLLLTVLWIWCAGCQKSPSEKIEGVQKTLDEAKKGQADRYAATEYTSAEETLKRAREENNNRNYSAAVQLAQDAEKKAKTAADASDKNKEAMKDSVKRTIDDTRKTLGQTKEEYENAKQLRVPEGDMAPAHSVLVSAETDLKQVDDILDSGDIITAYYKVNIARGNVTNALQDIRKLVAEKGAPHKMD